MAKKLLFLRGGKAAKQEQDLFFALSPKKALQSLEKDDIVPISLWTWEKTAMIPQFFE
ncbi:hypothetical protein [Vibrio variabilis]|uniref:hypothetical protein n=1 Tax=Vibrio variabilis TaxID=990271 RepID=UPI0013A6C471|nr:hypothetical protein [Vibrio variabilis]